MARVFRNLWKSNLYFTFSSACNEDLVKQKTEELAAQFDKNMKLEVEFTFLKVGSSHYLLTVTCFPISR